MFCSIFDLRQKTPTIIELLSSAFAAKDYENWQKLWQFPLQAHSAIFWENKNFFKHSAFSLFNTQLSYFKLKI